jgi:hypothetical protein
MVNVKLADVDVNAPLISVAIWAELDINVGLLPILVYSTYCAYEDVV